MGVHYYLYMEVEFTSPFITYMGLKQKVLYYISNRIVCIGLLQMLMSSLKTFFMINKYVFALITIGCLVYFYGNIYIMGFFLFWLLQLLFFIVLAACCTWVMH